MQEIVQEMYFKAEVHRWILVKNKDPPPAPKVSSLLSLSFKVGAGTLLLVHVARWLVHVISHVRSRPLLSRSNGSCVVVARVLTSILAVQTCSRLLRARPRPVIFIVHVISHVRSWSWLSRSNGSGVVVARVLTSVLSDGTCSRLLGPIVKPGTHDVKSIVHQGSHVARQLIHVLRHVRVHHRSSLSCLSCLSKRKIQRGSCVVEDTVSVFLH